jgi:hypothetical protein
MSKEKVNITTLAAAAAIVLMAPAILTTGAFAQEGQPGGPRQIPDEDLGCHFVNPADKVNSNPNACSFHEFPTIPDCTAADNVQAPSDSCRPSSGEF